MIEYLLPVILAFFVILTKTLDYEGVFVSLVFSYIIILRQDVYWFFVMLVFLVIGSAATRYKIVKKRKMTSKTRGMSNVIANGIIAVIMALTGHLYGFVGAIAAACGDTLSSEIGFLSKQKPVMITTFKKVNAGKNGAISPLGTSFSIIGGLIIGASALLINYDPKLLVVGAVAGFMGSAFDSYLGAWFENDKYMTNFAVNLMATCLGAIVGVLIYALW